MGRVVLVTGVATDLGRRLADLLVAQDDVERVVGVDVQPPRGDLGRVQFVRADIRNAVIAKVIAREQVDTIVHMSVAASSYSGRTARKELNVIGTMQLLAAAQQSTTVRQLVVKSSGSYYATSNRDPAMFTEQMGPKRAGSGYAKDVAEVEGYVRGFARRRPDVVVTTLRAANVVGPGIETPVTSYLRMPVVPTVLGFDPRLQFLHPDDMLGALLRATQSGIGGTFNIAGDGLLTLSQVLRRLGRPSLAVPAFAMGRVTSTVRQARLADLVPDLVPWLTYGRGMDTTRMREQLGFEPRYTTAQALADFGSALGPGPLSAERVERSERRVRALLSGGGRA